MKIDSGETKDIIVTYTPNSKNRDCIEEFMLPLKIEDGDKIMIKCIGYCQVGTLITKSKKEGLDFSKVPIG